MRDKIHSPPPATPQAVEGVATPPPAVSNVELLYRPDPNRVHPPIDGTVEVPRQVREAAERAEDLIAGRPPRHPPADARIAEAQAWLETMGRSSPAGRVALEIFQEGVQSIKARRQ